MITESITDNFLSQELSNLKSQLFTGKLSIKGREGQQWYMYFYLGRVLYASGGKHEVRRWLRNLSIHCFATETYQPDTFARLTDISPLNEYEIMMSWEYFLLVSWIKNQKISRQNTVNFIQASITEVIFDIIQAIDFTCEVVKKEQLNPQLALFDIDQVYADVMQDWKSWQTSQLATISPDHSPVMLKPEVLQATIDPAAYDAFEVFLDGKRSLREIAAQRRRSVQEVSTSLLPYMKRGEMGLVKIPDFVSPAEQYLSDFHLSNNFFQEILPLVACIDNSETVCDRMANIFVGAGFQFVGINDSAKAVSTIVTINPALIFLDLVISSSNGYEICSEIRKIPRFQQTPIVILAANDGMVERMRAKMAGASDLITTPFPLEDHGIRL
jgi:two-component system, chemotaxis family, response regulator PixG